MLLMEKVRHDPMNDFGGITLVVVCSPGRFEQYGSSVGKKIHSLAKNESLPTRSRAFISISSSSSKS